MFREAQTAFPETFERIKLKICPFYTPAIGTFDPSMKIGGVNLLTAIGLSLASLVYLLTPDPLHITACVLVNLLSVSAYTRLYYDITYKDEKVNILLFPMLFFPFFNPKFVMFHEFSHVALNHKGNSRKNEKEANNMTKARLFDFSTDALEHENLR